MVDNYFIFDGSALCAQIRTLRKRHPSFSGRRLDPVRFVRHLQKNLQELGSASYKRATFYFPKGDESAAGSYLLMPDFRTPALVRDLHFKFCGEKLKGGAAYSKWVETVPKRWLDRVSKSEKGIDIEICCDALKLASASRLDRLFLFTNDADFRTSVSDLKGTGHKRESRPSRRKTHCA